MANPKGSEEHATEQSPRALDLRIAGCSYRTIGAQLGVSYQTAYRWVQDALADLDEIRKEKAEKLREIELERLDKMTLHLWPKVQAGDGKAVRTLVAVMDRRAKLLGLDAPTKISDPAGNPLVFTLKIDGGRSDAE